MDPDATLAWILRLRATLDDAIERGARVDEDAVYTLVGLVAELDDWLASGRVPPVRWRPALPHPGQGALLVLRTGEASNETAPGRRRALVRSRGAGPGQLSLPFALQGG